MKKHERTRLEQLLKDRTKDSLSESDTRILIRLSAKRAAELQQQSDPHRSSQPGSSPARGAASPG